jgi:hypothetical protein
MTESREAAWKLKPSEVEATVAEALRHRSANRRENQNLEHLPYVWRDRSTEIQNWTMKTHFAIVLTGLIAKATDYRANSRSLRSDGNEEPGRFSAPQVWSKFYTRAVDAGVSTNGLKRMPHNNQPYLAKPWVEKNTESTNVETKRLVALVFEWLNEANELNQFQAREALDAFLVEVPDIATLKSLRLSVDNELSPQLVFLQFEGFLNADTENGRRGQAFTAACLRLLHGDDVVTPASVHDPNFTALGDVSIVTETKSQGAEAKQKVVKIADVKDTAIELRTRAPGATLVYAALVNAHDGFSLRQNWKQVTEETGVLTVIYDDASTLIRDVVIASAQPFTEAIIELGQLLYEQLAHIEVRAETLNEWLAILRGLGIRTHTETLY